jgi:hypothetical protein
VQAQLRQRQPMRKVRIISLPRPLRLVAGLVLCLVAVTTVYAVVQFRTQDPGLEDEMITPINLSQTVGDMTFTVDWAYADANRIALGYSIRRENGVLANSWLSDVRLTDSEGRQYFPIGPLGMDHSIPEMLSTDAHFDASIIENGIGQDAPKELKLHLKVKNTFDFDFKVPFQGGVRIEEKNFEFDNLTASVKWAIISPSMTLLYLCYQVPEDGAWYADVELNYDGERVARESGASYFLNAQPQVDGGFCREDRFLTTYRKLPKTLTLNIRYLQTPTYYSEENMKRAAAVLAKYGVEVEVKRNMASDRESYLLNIPNPPLDYDFFDKIWEEAMESMGEPLEGQRMKGPWILTLEVP